jgi:hypothetical protein
MDRRWVRVPSKPYLYLVVQRAVIRNGSTRDLAGILVRDIRRHLDWFISQSGLRPKLSGAAFYR